MGCISSRPAKANAQGSKATNSNKANIEQRLLQAQKISKKTVKILLLGAGESGKSTVLKQMRLLHSQGFTDFERIQYTKVIWNDSIRSMQILIRNALRLNIPTSKDPDLVAARVTVMRALGGDGKTKMTDAEDLQDYQVDFEQDVKKQAREAAYHAAIAKRDVELIEGNELLEDQYLDIEVDDNGEKESLLPQTVVATKQEIASAIALLWERDPSIHQTLARANEFQLEVNAGFYFQNISKFCQDNYKASDQDILLGRIKTTGITETNFDIRGSVCKMIDVGGQRSERKKWIHCFDNVSALLFVAAVSEFDEKLFEDRSMNRMVETLSLFDQTINSRWFAQTPIILFLNKTDILKAKLKKRSFKAYFESFTGDQTDEREVCAYLKKVFLSINRVPSRPIYVHYTCATDSESMKFVISAVTDVVFQKNLLGSGIV